jgi:hypothetical protein
MSERLRVGFNTSEPCLREADIRRSRIWQCASLTAPDNISYPGAYLFLEQGESPYYQERTVQCAPLYCKAVVEQFELCRLQLLAATGESHQVTDHDPNRLIIYIDRLLRLQNLKYMNNIFGRNPLEHRSPHWNRRHLGCKGAAS